MRWDYALLDINPVFPGLRDCYYYYCYYYYYYYYYYRFISYLNGIIQVVGVSWITNCNTTLGIQDLSGNLSCSQQAKLLYDVATVLDLSFFWYSKNPFQLYLKLWWLLELLLLFCIARVTLSLSLILGVAPWCLLMSPWWLHGVSWCLKCWMGVLHQLCGILLFCQQLWCLLVCCAPIYGMFVWFIGMVSLYLCSIISSHSLNHLTALILAVRANFNLMSKSQSNIISWILNKIVPFLWF